MSDLLINHRDDSDYPGLDFVGEIVWRFENMDSLPNLVFCTRINYDSI